MDLVPIVMVMGQGEGTHGGKGQSDATTSAVCVVMEVNGDILKDNNGSNGDVLAVVMFLKMLKEVRSSISINPNEIYFQVYFSIHGFLLLQHNILTHSGIAHFRTASLNQFATLRKN